MANLFLTDKCNRGCDFCFARKGPWSENYPKKGLSVEEIKRCFDHFNGDRSINGLLGGEPFLYPELITVLNMMWERQLVPKIFTSATNPMPDSLKDIDLQKFPLHFVVNIGTKNTYNDFQSGNLLDFFSKFHEVSSLSYTILDLNANVDFLFDCIREFDLKKNIRVGIALPILNGGNQYVAKEDYKEFGRFFMQFAEQAHNNNVVLGPDCGFVACMFSPAEIGQLQLWGMDMNFCCGAAIDIGPDLEAWNCFPLSQLKRLNIFDYPDVMQLKIGFDEYMDNLFDGQKGIYDECVNCKHMKQRQCDGGCKSFKTIKEKTYA